MIFLLVFILVLYFSTYFLKFFKFLKSLIFWHLPYLKKALILE